MFLIHVEALQSVADNIFSILWHKVLLHDHETIERFSILMCFLYFYKFFLKQFLLCLREIISIVNSVFSWLKPIQRTLTSYSSGEIPSQTSTESFSSHILFQ